MSRTITSKLSLTQMAQTINVKDTFTIQINHEFLNHNFSMIKECLLKLQDLQNDVTKQKTTKSSVDKQIKELKQKVIDSQRIANQHDIKIKQLQNNIGDNFMKKIYDLQTKTKNIYDFQQTVRRIQDSKKFVSSDQSAQNQAHLQTIQDKMSRLSEQMSRYTQKTSFNKQCQITGQQIEGLRRQILQLRSLHKSSISSINQISQKCNVACSDVEQISHMIKQVNFSQMQKQITKFKQESQQRISQISIKLKKKCGLNDLSQFQKNIIQKLDRFYLQSQKGKAGLAETKDALLYLEKRLNQVYDILVSKETQQENDALFSAKKINCASCTKDLGKFQGKLGQFRPWAIFPCKQLDPEKTGGLGYLTYVDKMHYRRGLSVNDDSNLDRLNKTFERSRQQQRDSPKKMNSTRTTNFMSNYGQEKQITSLKEQYFKQLKGEKTGQKIFRVKKQSVKPSTAMQLTKDKVSNI